MTFEPLLAAGTVQMRGVDFPRYATVNIDDPALHYTVVLHLHAADSNGLTVVGLQVALKRDWTTRLPAVATVLAAMPLEEWVRISFGAIVATLRHGGPIQMEQLLHPDARLRASAVRALEAGIAAADEPVVQRRRTITDSFLDEVAAVYVGAMTEGRHPTQAVRDELGASGYSTAARWVSKAREAQKLPPSGRSKGRSSG